MKKIIKEIIIVEGKDDISAVKAAVDAEIFQVNGFAVRKKGAMEKIIKAYENKGIIILTDPDHAGNEIRKYINKFFPEAKNAFISRKEGSKDDDIGVENASPEAIISALENAKCSVLEDKEEVFTSELLLDLGLIGNKNSSFLREKISDSLRIGYSNGKQFLSKLNRYGITKEEFLKVYNEVIENK